MSEILYANCRSNRVMSVEAKIFPDRNWALLCPVCGDIWGRVATAHTQRWLPMLRGCKIAHARDLLDLPGSLMIDQEFFKPYAMPQALLLEELGLAEKGGGIAYPIVSWYNPHSNLTEIRMTPELSDRIAELRDKTLKGTITMEELKESMAMLRESRQFAAAKAGAAKRSERAASSATPINTDELLKSFF